MTESAARMKYTVYEMYTEKMNNIKIPLILLHLKKSNKSILYLIELPICNSAKCKIQFKGHWLLYSTTPNATTLFTDKTQAIKFTFIFLLQIWPDHCLFSNSYHRQAFNPSIIHCTQKRDNVFNRYAQIWQTRANMTTNWQQNIGNAHKIRCHTFYWKPAVILELVIMEYKR